VLRVGWLLTPSTLLYVSGGLAWANIQVTSTCSPTPTANVEEYNLPTRPTKRSGYRRFFGPAHPSLRIHAKDLQGDSVELDAQ
jgi:hypothetical protein